MGVVITTVLRISAGANVFEAQLADPAHPFTADTFTLPEDQGLFRATTDQFSAQVPQGAFDIFRMEEQDFTEGDALADQVAATLAKDVNRFAPERPGVVRPATFPFGTPDFRDAFYEGEEDRSAILSVVRERKQIEIARGDRPFETVFSTNRFLLQEVREPKIEKAQIIETLGDPQLFLFGSRAEVYSYAGILLNTRSFDWKSEFLRGFETYLRGSRARENKTRVFLVYDNVLREGVILGATINQSQTNLRYVTFQFSMFIVRKRLFSLDPSRALGTREEFILKRTNQASDVAATEQAAQNQLGIPILYDPSITVPEKSIVQSKVNQAVQLGSELPFLFLRIPRSTPED